MPYNPSTGVYSLPAIYLAVPGTVIIAAQHNTPLEDLATANNYARPVIAGGTGANNITSAATNLEVVSYGAIQVLSDAETANARSNIDAAGLDVVNTFTKTQIWAKGADVASASTLTLGDDGNYFDVTGTTAITSIATVGVGTVIKLHFDGVLTLTHHSTDLVLPGGANITTAAGDEAEFVEYAAGDWRCTNYQRASLTPTPLFSKSFVSSEQTIASAGLLTLAHGLGEAPKFVAPVLICKTAEFNYSIGDIIPMPESLATATLNNFGASIEISGTTNILVRFASATNAFIYPNKTTGNAENLTNANWKLIMRAYA